MEAAKSPNLLDPERDGDPIQNAMMDWWLEWKRQNPKKVVDVATAFEAGWLRADAEASSASPWTRQLKGAAILDAMMLMQRMDIYAHPTHVARSDDGELVVEWRAGRSKAIATFDGSGTFGVAIVDDDTVTAATHDGRVEDFVPMELSRFLVNMEREIRHQKSWRIVEREAP